MDGPGVTPLGVRVMVFMAEAGADGQCRHGAWGSACGCVGPAMYVGVTRPEVVDVRGLVVARWSSPCHGVFTSSSWRPPPSWRSSAGRPVVGVLGVVGALAAATVHPLQVMLRGVVDKLLFGERPDPLGAAAHVVGQIGDDPVLALRAIREALVLPYAALSVDGRSWPPPAGP